LAHRPIPDHIDHQNNYSYKTSKTISKAIATFLCTFAFVTIASTQTPPTPPATDKSKTKSTIATSSKRSSQKVDINMNGNKIRLEMDDDVFDLDMVFDFDATDVIAAITDELGSPNNSGRFRTWEGNGYDNKVKDDNLDVFINRHKVSQSTLSHMEDILKAFFKDLELDIDINH
jgi:hypothetical protein